MGIRQLRMLILRHGKKVDEPYDCFNLLAGKSFQDKAQEGGNLFPELRRQICKFGYAKAARVCRKNKQKTKQN